MKSVVHECDRRTVCGKCRYSIEVGAPMIRVVIAGQAWAEHLHCPGQQP